MSVRSVKKRPPVSSLLDVLQLLDVLGAGLDRRTLEVLAGHGVRRLDDADVVEQEHHLAAELCVLEQRTDVRRGAVPVLGQALDDHRHVARAHAFIGDQLVLDRVGTLAGALLDGAVDDVVRHRLLARGLDGQRQARIHRRIGHAHLGGDHDLADQLAGDLRATVGGDLFLAVQPLTAHGDSLLLEGGAQDGGAGVGWQGRAPASTANGHDGCEAGRHHRLGDLPAGHAWQAVFAGVSSRPAR
jgi:hypothetical protein